jgi:hypothetical protein
MKAQPHRLAAIVLLATTTAAVAQFVKGNEAVKLLPDGTRKVETPPLPSTSLGKPCPASQNTCVSSSWKMLETPTGLAECTEFYGRDGTCKASSFGSEKRPRSWIVKTGGQWLQCPQPSISEKCVSLKSLLVTTVH